MANQLTIDPNNGARTEEREKRVRYKVSLSGSYTQHQRGTGVGEVLNLDAAANPGYLPDAYWGEEGPDICYPINSGGTGYVVSLVPGADALHPLLCIYSNVATELAAGPAPLKRQ